MSDRLTVLRWDGCYDSGWKGVITPQSFAHPAKYSRNLIERIYQHCLERGYLKKGDTVGDCFGGIGTGGITSAYAGLEWIGVELEPRFVTWAEDNFKLHQPAWTTMRLPWPRIIQGDSRNFHVLVGEDYDAMVSSPPYVDSNGHPSMGHFLDESGGDVLGRTTTGAKRGDEEYGASGGQIGSLKSGEVQAVISSPPYSDIAAGAGGLNTKPASKPGQQSGRRPESASQSGNWSKDLLHYGKSDGQISRLKGGAVEAVVTSPPWEENCEGGVRKSKFNYAPTQGNGHGCSPEARAKQLEREEERKYGESPGQIGRLSDETYWQAMDAVYRSCFMAIKPGGVIVLVVKDYVAKKKRVPLCDDTCRLLTHIGFVMIERIQAMLVSEDRHAGLFGDDVVKTKERKSFFRRLAEKKGSPKIDYEEVLIARRL